MPHRARRLPSYPRGSAAHALIAWGVLAGAPALVRAEEAPPTPAPGPAPATQPARPAPAVAEDTEPPPAASSAGRRIEVKESPGGDVMMNEARRRFDAGVDLYRKGLYRAAHAEFERAYDLSALPELLYNLGNTLQALGRLAEAADRYERYLKASPGATDRAAVEELIGQLRRELQLRDDETRRASPAPGPGSSGSRGGPPRAALALTIGGGATLLVGVALGLSAYGIGRSLSSAERFDPGLDQTGRTLAPTGLGLGIVGGVALGAGAIWLGVHRSRAGAERGEKRTALLFVPGPGSVPGSVAGSAARGGL